MSDARVEKIAVEVVVRRVLNIEGMVVADVKRQLERFAEDDQATILEFLPPIRIEPLDMLDGTASRYRSQLPEGEDFREWFVLRMEALAVAKQPSYLAGGPTP